MSRRSLAPLVLVVLTLTAGCHTVARNPEVSGGVRVETENASVDVRFGSRERRLIRQYYASSRGLPPGLAKKEKLPPGLAKQVRRDGRLPPGLEARRLPRELERDLPRPREGYVRLRVGLDVVLMNRDTRVIVDVIRDIGS